MTGGALDVVVAGRLPSGFSDATFGNRVHFHVASIDEEFRSLLPDADVLYSWRVPDTVPGGTPRLRWIQLPSAGADHLRGLPVWTSDIVITASQGAHTVPMSEHLFAMLLGLTRNIPTIVRAQDRKEWHRDARWRELRGATLGIIGWGRIGGGVAHLARAFGMRVIGTRWSLMAPREAGSDSVAALEDPPWVEAVDLPPDIVYPAVQLHDVLGQSDAVVLLLPLTDSTRGAFGAAEFRAMKRGSLFFNLGRGPVVDEPALVEALRSGWLGGAGLDVFAREPLPRTSPLWTMPNVIISPHVGGQSENTQERAARLFAVNLTRYLEGRELLNVVERDLGY